MKLSLDYFDDGYIMFIDLDSKTEIGYKYSYNEYKYYIDTKELYPVKMSSSIFADPDSYPNEQLYDFVNDNDKQQALTAIIKYVKTEGFDNIEDYYRNLENECQD